MSNDPFGGYEVSQPKVHRATLIANGDVVDLKSVTLSSSYVQGDYTGSMPFTEGQEVEVIYTYRHGGKTRESTGKVKKINNGKIKVGK